MHHSQQQHQHHDDDYYFQSRDEYDDSAWITGCWLDLFFMSERLFSKLSWSVLHENHHLLCVITQRHVNIILSNNHGTSWSSSTCSKSSSSMNTKTLLLLINSELLAFDTIWCGRMCGSSQLLAWCGMLWFWCGIGRRRQVPVSEKDRLFGEESSRLGEEERQERRSCILSGGLIWSWVACRKGADKTDWTTHTLTSSDSIMLLHSNSPHHHVMSCHVKIVWEVVWGRTQHEKKEIKRKRENVFVYRPVDDSCFSSSFSDVAPRSLLLSSILTFCVEKKSSSSNIQFRSIC